MLILGSIFQHNNRKYLLRYKKFKKNNKQKAQFVKIKEDLFNKFLLNNNLNIKEYCLQ